MSHLLRSQAGPASTELAGCPWPIALWPWAAGASGYCHRAAVAVLPLSAPRVPARMDAFCAGSATVRQIAWKAPLRLTKRYRKLAAKGKPIQVVVTAIAREMHRSGRHASERLSL
jgi:hypothetical protein